MSVVRGHEEIIEDLTMRYGTREPFVLAERLGIRVVKCALPRSVRSYYLVVGTVFWIFLNSMLPLAVQQDLVAKAIAHHHLHSNVGELDEHQREQSALFAKVLQSPEEKKA